MESIVNGEIKNFAVDALPPSSAISQVRRWANGLPIGANALRAFIQFGQNPGVGQSRFLLVDGLIVAELSGMPPKTISISRDLLIADPGGEVVG
jgi:hypothetical protein